jgi:RHS repeat-associated protein
MHARLHEDDCKNICNQAVNEENRCAAFIEQYKKLGPNEGEACVQALNDAIGCCSRAISRYDTVLNDIAQQSHARRHNGWRPQMKKDCENNKNRLTPVLNDLKNALNNTLSSVAFEKAKALHEEAERKAALANTKNQNCPPRHLNNVDAVVSILIETANLYEEAASKEHEALAILTSAPSPKDENIVVLKQSIENYQAAANKYKKEAAEWPATVLAQKATLKERLAVLKEDSRLFEEKGLKRSSYELKKQMLPVLEQLVESSLNEEEGIFKEELTQLKHSIAAFETEADNSRLTESTYRLSQEEFKSRENERREHFFKSDILNPELFLPCVAENVPRPFALPLDGHVAKNGKNFTLYNDQFYRFLVQSDLAVSELLIKVYEKGESIYEERITLPLKNEVAWERYLTTGGMALIPETKLKAEFGLNLRLHFVCDPMCAFSMVISQKGEDSRYQFSISLDETATLYECNFSVPPPWQLDVLRKPALPNVDKPNGNSVFSASLTFNELGKNPSHLEQVSFPILDRFVEQFKKDPLLLAQYVYHEIALVDPFLQEENGVLQAPSIHRSPLMTYLEKQGSPWEQCHLLVYLLKKAGYRASCVIGDPLSLPKAYLEKMLLTKLPEEQEEGLVKYPWVILWNGEEQISLFPWMKEIQVHEGHDLYNFMPQEYASADSWILCYLKGDEKILKHIGPDGDDTTAVLFTRFVEEELRKQGLSLSDVGIHRRQLKKQFVSWKDFPRPSSIQGNHQIIDFLDNIPNLFAYAEIEVFSHENPHKKLNPIQQFLVMMNCWALSIRFEASGETSHVLCIGGFDENKLNLDQTDHNIDIKVTYVVPLGSEEISQHKTFSISKGTAAALCFSFGEENSEVISQFYNGFTNQKEDHKRLSSLLAFVGAAYFEKCSRGEKTLADLHKIIPRTVLAFGLAKLAPDLSKGPVKGNPDPTLPQVDMIRICPELPSNPHLTAWHQEIRTAVRQWKSLTTVDQSSNEHQILREIFKDPYAVSTVKLLQLAHQQHQKNGFSGEGFLVFTPSSFEAAEKIPEAAQSLYFSHLKDLNLRDVKASSLGEWNAVKDLLDLEKPLGSWAYAYMTPGLTFSQDGTYKEMGALIFHPYTQYALISSNNLVFNGGLGSPLPSYYFAPSSISQWQLVPTSNGYLNSYALQVPFQLPSFTSSTLPNIPSTSSWPNILPTIVQSQPGTTTWRDDVRAIYKATVNYVGDPVDIVTGAFYIDETDLVLPGPFSLTIRRNYNSQNPLIGSLGCGWKLSLNPFLIDQDGKRFAAELDGTVIVYRYNRQTDRWEVFPEDNLELSNFNQQGIGSSASPFHSYIENDVLYGADGSKRFFEDGLLKKWVDDRGNILTFSYDNERLSRIESSNGDFCGVHYNHEGNIDEIYAKDGRHVSYSYNSQGDLVKVTLPNTAIITYEYDHAHRVLRETKPHGKAIENIYDDQGRVKKQKTPMGLQQEMIPTAIFEYTDGITTVTDANEKKTTYKIFEKQIYKVTDPLGFSILQAWFIDEKSWFDPETEKVTEWNQKGGAIRSLKSTTDKRGLTTSYLYDSRENPEIITLEGEDLTGSRESKATKKLVYNDRNLCIEEEIYGQKTITTYDSTFLYLPKRIEKYSRQTLISYVDLEYNSLGQLEKEDHSGSVTFWKYNARGFPNQKIQITGTGDPDVVTTYAYNHQGQCIKVTSADGIQENDYDLMGNQIESKVFSPSGTLLSATYMGYDLNNMPIWRQAANPQNTIYFDYHASGLIKAVRQNLAPSRSVAYTLYEYDSCGYLIEETDPRGYCTYREYDAIGQIKSETKEGHTTLFTYEPGGMVETITSPSGAKTIRLYTTNGLLKEVTFPDGTKSSIIYDFFGRPILETKNDISWEIKYDDANHRVIRTQLKTKITEISEFDARDNLIRFTDAADYISKKAYDGLNRIKTETSPSGEQTVWSYQGDLSLCTLLNGETTTNRYEGGRIIESEITDSRGTLIAQSSFHYDPEADIQQVIQGEEVTTTWMNALGLPLKVQKGNITTIYEYDFCGNCTILTDGDGRVTRQTFDGLRRITQKELPDGSVLGYTYDLDSNLSEYHLPNDAVWKASYDTMGRKILEELQAGRQSSLRWEYTYENGYLKEAKDPMQRVRTYLYEPSGRLSQEIVDGGRRTYTYDPRGFIATAEQTRDSTASWLSSWVYGSNSEHSLVERIYDSDGRISLELIYLNSNLIQQTKQTWDTSSRSLQIDGHTRDFIYQNNRLVQVSTDGIDLSYTYDLSGSLKSKSTPWSTTAIGYNASGLPENIQTRLPDGAIQESLEWYASGKLFFYSSPGQQKRFTYTTSGYLQAAGAETYNFDFGISGIGVRTAAPGWIVPQNGIDAFGKILTEIIDKNSTATTYNPMGEAITHGQRQLDWDPWGRLIKVSDGAFTWEASYDALGRRLQTRYTPGWSSTLTTTSFYDPEEEFQEIGVKYGDKTFWKIHGPNSCDAVTDETGVSVVLMHNTLDQLAGVVSRQGTVYSEQFPSSYGLQSSAPSIPTDLFSYAQSLNWHSQAQDPTGLIWMGARYYEPKGGRFLSPDPIGYPLCLDLYAYAGGDPVNYLDLDGRCFSSAYQLAKPTVLEIKSTFSNAWHNPHVQGSIQAFCGFTQAGAGGLAILGTNGLAAPIAWPAFVLGVDQFITGMGTAITGRPRITATEHVLQKAGMPAEWAFLTTGVASAALTMGSTAIIRSAQSAALYNFRLPPAPSMANSGRWVLPKEGGGAFINGRWYVEHALERMAPRTPQVMAELESRFLARAKVASQNLNPRKFREWCLKNAPDPRGVPPSVVEAEIAQPGSTGVRVMLNENGHVITVIPGGQ